MHLVKFLFCYPFRTRPKFYASRNMLFLGVFFCIPVGHRRSSLNIILCTCYPNWNPWPRSFPNNRKRNSRSPILWSQYTKRADIQNEVRLINMYNQFRVNFLNMFHLFVIHPALRHRNVLAHLVFKTVIMAHKKSFGSWVHLKSGSSSPSRTL